MSNLPKIKIDNETMMSTMHSVQNGGFWLPNNGYRATQIVESYPVYFEIVKETLSGKLVKLTPRGEKRLEKLMSA